jgi:hypothetical protein
MSVNSYTAAEKFLAAGRNPGQRKLANNTVVRRTEEGELAIRLHETDVVTFTRLGITILNSGGWKTVTTKDRINEALSGTGWRLSQERGQWYVGYADSAANRHVFADGMKICANNRVNGAAKAGSDKEAVKLRAAATKYAKGFAEALAAGKVALPGPGDCWGCLMKDSNGKTVMGADHILSHFEERYYVPSLALNAIDEFPISPIARDWLAQHMACGASKAANGREADFEFARGIAERQISQSIRRYCLRQLGQAT